jgi:hypothetical protein
MRAVSLGHKFDEESGEIANGSHSTLERSRRGVIAIGDLIDYVVRNCLNYLDGICKSNQACGASRKFLDQHVM